jgi:antitoxin component HigA of HigAB toxin-antitoxin module
MKSLLDLVKALYGPKALSSTLGTRTNVVRLPSGKLQKYVSTDLNVEAASDAAAINAYKEMEKLVPDIPKMNDAERLIFEGNLRRLKNKLEASGLIKGEELINQPSSITEIQSKLDQLKQKGKELEKVTGEKTTLTDVLKDLGESQISLSRMQDVGLVRATARQILINDIKAGKIKNITVEEAINMGEPIDPFRKIYGEGALEQLDSLIPNLRNLKTEIEAEKLARSKFKFEPDENRLPGSVSIEEAKKAEQEFGINKPAKVTDLKTEATRRTSIDDLIDEYNANQDRLLLTDDEGATLITYPEYNRLKDRNEQIAKILEEKGIKSKPEVETKQEGIIIPFRKKPTEPEGKAEGGRIGYAQGTPAMGLDYLTGMEPSKGYADGGRIGFKAGSGKKVLDLILEANQKLKNKKSMETTNPKTGEVTTPKEPVTVAQKYDQDIIKAADEIYPSYDDPKIAADQIVDSYAQMKYGLEDQYGLSNKERMDLYRQAYDYVMDYNRGIVGKTAGEFNISDEATAKALTDFARENDPEGFKKIQKIVDDINNKNALENFDIKNREPNAVGGRVGFAEGTRDAPSITLDTHDKAPANMDKYPVKLGNLELGIMGGMRSGQSTPDPYVKINTADRNFTVRGKYNIPDTGISLLGDIGDIRSRSRVNIDVPQYDYKETFKDVMRLNPYSVGIEYAPDQNKNINLRYDDRGNVTLRGKARFAKGGLGYLMGE